MYYEERVIGGVLHWRGLPNGDFEPCSPKMLTGLLVEARQDAEKWRLINEAASTPPVKDWSGVDPDRHAFGGCYGQ